MIQTKKIRKITFLKEDLVYSTNVPDTENYITEGGLVNKNCVIDRFYDGEIIVNLHNPTANPVQITDGMKIAQCLLLPVPNWAFEEAPPEEVLNQLSDRGAKGFGSSGI